MKALKLKDIIAWVLAFFFIYIALGNEKSGAMKFVLEMWNIKPDFGIVMAANALVAGVGSTLFVLKFGSWKTKKEIETK